MRRVTWVLAGIGAVVCFVSYWPLYALGLRLPWITFFQIIIGFVAMLAFARGYDAVKGHL